MKQREAKLRIIPGGKTRRRTKSGEQHMNTGALIGKLLQKLKNPRLLMTGESKLATRVEKNLSLLFAATSIISIIIGFLVLVLLLSLTGCDGSYEDLKNEIEKHKIGNLKSQDKNNPEVLVYYQMFKQEARERGIADHELPAVDFYIVSRIQPNCNPIDSNCIAGIAVIKKSGERFISIDRMYWTRFKQDRREMLVFHELFHALFRQKHDTICLGKVENGFCEQPASLMYPILSRDAKFYMQNKKTILDYDFGKVLDDY